MRTNFRGLGRRGMALLAPGKEHPMAGHDNYIFFDGSALLADVKRLRSEDPRFADKRLDLMRLVQYFGNEALSQYHGRAYRRATFYFVQKDERLAKLVDLPTHTAPGTVSDVRIEYCGKRLREAAQAREWLDGQGDVPQYVRDSLYRAEKAVDTQICCDALQLAAQGKLDRLFLYTNDYDFVPLVRSLRQLGCNANLIRLRGDNVNAELAAECDAFDVVAEDYSLRQVFRVADG